MRQAREARGLSIDDVAYHLRLHRQYIEGMESGNLRSLPPGPYRKAFIKEYAKFLNIKFETLQQTAPPEEKDNILSSAVSAMPGVAKKMTKSAVRTTESVVKKVEEGVKDAVEEITARDLWEEADQVRAERLGITQRQDEEPSMPIRKKDEPPTSRTPTETSSLTPTEIRRVRRLELDQRPPVQEYAPAYEKEKEVEVRTGMSRATKTIVGLLVIIAAIVGYSIFTKKQNQPSASIEPEQKTAVKLPEQKPTPVIPSKKDSVSAIVSSNDSLIFTISAKDSVWVSISPDIGKGFRGKLAKGEVKRFSAKDKYFLFLGNQKSVSMTLDGKPLVNLPTIAGSNIVVRNVILTRDKVTVAPSEENKSDSKKEIHPNPPRKMKESAKKKAAFPQKKKPQPTPDKKAVKNAPIKKHIPSVKPVLPG